MRSAVFSARAGTARRDSRHRFISPTVPNGCRPTCPTTATLSRSAGTTRTAKTGLRKRPVATRAERVEIRATRTHNRCRARRRFCDPATHGGSAALSTT